MDYHALDELGWNAWFAASFAALTAPGTQPGRIAAQSESTFHLFVTADHEVPAVMSGRLTGLAASDPANRPVVGDWVVYSPGSGDSAAIIRDVLPRQTVFQRKTAQSLTAVQTVAANITALFLVTSADAGFNLRRLERYLVQALESGAMPVAVLNKADLAADPDRLVQEIRAIAPGIPVHAVSAARKEGIEDLQPYLRAGNTVALLGSSGVGKSTLVNAIAGTELRRVGEVREDDSRGRHTTTDRRLLRLPSGAMLLDTPGMRELALWADAETVGEAFPDIRALADECRFSDCAHKAEPGCAVKHAVDTGLLQPKRLASYLKLSSEAAHLAARRAAKSREAPKARPRRVPGDVFRGRPRQPWD